MTGECVWFEGKPFPSRELPSEHLREVQENFIIKDEDVLLLTYPKSGMNWLMETVCLIHLKGDPKWIQSVPIGECSPWVEAFRGYNLLKDKEGPRFITSHLPVQLFPRSFFKSKAKPIIQSEVSQKDKEHYSILDTRNTVEKICQFLGKELEPEELNSVLKNSSFQAMKENNMSNYSLAKGLHFEENAHLLRKGVTGDWKNHFTVAQAEIFDKLFQEKMADLPQELFPWE
ncbi:hypothetical protein FD754_017701 [Muntiacus muntjak]|uniref:Sulfotransferase n=1 Tax=Muntiacus muntjak TaxID=9888 RepID=A0A5N3VUG7_MUNMU|nr:hypothetical protein FD754_017701 [Muntiacus muntjak]